MWTKRRSDANEPFFIFPHDALRTVSNTAWVRFVFIFEYRYYLRMCELWGINAYLRRKSLQPLGFEQGRSFVLRILFGGSEFISASASQDKTVKCKKMLMDCF